MLYAIDFDDTLNFSSLDGKFDPNYKLISFLRDKRFFVLTARAGTDSNKNYINDFLEFSLLFPNKVIFTNEALKGPFLKEEGADHLIDDNAEQRGSAKEFGIKASHPKDLESLIFSMEKSASLKEVDNLNSEYLPADELRDKSWYRTSDKSWYYWAEGETDLKNKPLNPDDALRELINFSYENGIETLPSWEGHALSNEEANSTFKKLLRDKEKINNKGLKLINTEDKSEKIIFKDPDYDLPFDEPKDLVHERYSGYIGLKFNNKDLPEYIFEQIADIDNAVDVKLEGDTLHIYVDSDSQKKQKDLWKEITEIIKAEVETSRKEARKKYFFNLIKEAKDPKKGTGKKPKGSKRRLYTDENPKDTVPVKFRTVSDIKETLSRSDFKSKSHARQSQIINLIHQRVRAAYQNAKDPKTKARLRRALKYAEKRKEQSKNKTEKMKKESKRKRISFFRTNLDYGERNSRKKEDKADDYNAPKEGKKRWSTKYKKKIDCSNPKGFSQKQYCKRKRRGGAYKE